MSGTPNIVLRKMTDVDVEELAPGEYVPLSSKSDYGTLAWVGWCCPRCHEPLLLLRANHTVDYDGVVTPNVSCPEDCEFAASMVLADWVPEPRGWA